MKISPTSPLNELDGLPVSIAPEANSSRNISSPPNESFYPGKVKDSTKVREDANLYTEEMRQRFIRRLLKNMPKLQNENHSISIQQYNGEPWMVNPPYGFLPFAIMSEKGEISKEQLIKAINWCGDKKRQFEKSGDYYRMWLYAQRQTMLAGILTHMVKFVQASLVD